MTPGQIAASRTAGVRREARAWERAGVIDGPTRAAIEAAYPSDGHAHAPAWRVVIFVIATVAIMRGLRGVGRSSCAARAP